MVILVLSLLPKVIIGDKFERFVSAWSSQVLSVSCRLDLYEKKKRVILLNQFSLSGGFPINLSYCREREGEHGDGWAGLRRRL
jgi:hypothetical protein